MQPRCTTADQKSPFPLLGARATPIVSGADTGGAWEAIELDLSPGGRSPLHTLSTDKLFYVAEGTMTLTLGTADHQVSAGGFVHVPAGTEHCYRNASGRSARMLVVTTGATQLPFLEGMSRLSAQGPPAVEDLAAHTAAYGVRILAPASV